MPSDFLDPRATWADPEAYDRSASELAAMFAANFAGYADGVTDDIRAAGPLTTPEAIESVTALTNGGSKGG